MCCRLAALTEDVGPMISQWTLGSAITHLRSFVSGMEVEQREVERWVVTTDMVEARKLAREARLATRNSQVDTEPVNMEVSPPPVQETGPVNTRTISMVPPPDQDTAFPSSLLAVPTITSPTSTLLHTITVFSDFLQPLSVFTGISYFASGHTMLCCIGMDNSGGGWRMRTVV